MASLYKRGKTWYVKYSLRGKTIRKTLKTTDKDVANRELAKCLEIEGESHRMVATPKNPACGEFIAKYKKWAASHRRERSTSTSLTSWRHLMEFSNPKRVGDIHPDDLERFKEHLLSDGNTKQTVNNKLKDVQAIISRGMRQGWYTGHNPVEGVERYPIARQKPQFHSKPDLAKLLKAAKERGQVAEWTVLLGAYAGLRKMEIVNARWDWFTFSKKEPTIAISAFPGFEIKDYEDRTIPMSQRIYKALYPHRQKDGFLFESAPSSEGKCRYRFDPKKVLDASLDDAGLSKKKPFQTLRITFCSLHAANKTPIYTVSKWAGHSSVRVTERFYLDAGAYDKAIDAI